MNLLCFHRQQVIKLLQKFHRHNYMEDVRGEKYNFEEFEENNRLFRFVTVGEYLIDSLSRLLLAGWLNEVIYWVG